MLKGLLILQLTFGINFGSYYFYRFTNMHFMDRNNLLIYNQLALLVLCIASPLLIVSGKFLLHRKKILY